MLSGRGGYCFEQNLLLRSVLLALGFQVSGLAARVLWNFPEHTLNPRTHMVLRVEINSTSYITDVGFGGLTPTGPLILHSEIEQRTSHETFRLLFDQDSYTLQVNLDQVWKPMYRFDLHEYLLPDYEVSNWYVSTHPNSLFTNSLISSIATPNYRYCLRNNQLAVYASGKKEKLQTLSSVSDLRKALSDIFQIRLDSFSNLDETLANLL
ncbi:MAG TPA: arylamine N-acetyltransferase [Stenomitos sp.]